MDKIGKKDAKISPATRQERAAEALRANLARRKAQQRQRGVSSQAALKQPDNNEE